LKALVNRLADLLAASSVLSVAMPASIPIRAANPSCRLQFLNGSAREHRQTRLGHPCPADVLLLTAGQSFTYYGSATINVSFYAKDVLLVGCLSLCACAAAVTVMLQSSLS
jgi:hypothetical protein